MDKLMIHNMESQYYIERKENKTFDKQNLIIDLEITNDIINKENRNSIKNIYFEEIYDTINKLSTKKYATLTDIAEEIAFVTLNKFDTKIVLVRIKQVYFKKISFALEIVRYSQKNLINNKISSEEAYEADAILEQIHI